MRLTINNRNIIIDSTEDEEYFAVTVSDSGGGMDKARLEKLFRTSSSVSTPGSDGEKGSGLGLILCREFIDKHNGRIWAENVPETGSKFTFTLPKTNGAVGERE